jgi:hypothetical protein
MPEEKSSQEKRSSGVMTKVIATVFASILAPLTVGLGIKYLSPSEKPPAPAPSGTEPSKDKDSTREASPAAAVPEPRHFNGTDLTGFNTYPAEHGRDNVPKGVFTVQDGMLRISGEEPGYLATKKAYHHYTLHTEYKWGEKTWPPREAKARNSGIAVHADSEGLLEVALKGSYQCYLGEGRTGAISLMAGDPPPAKMNAEVDPKKSRAVPALFQYMPRGIKTPFTAPASLYSLTYDPAWKDVTGFRGKNDAEKPRGEWNTLEIICGLNNLVVILNGKTVNRVTQMNRNKGKILFRSSLAEIFFRKIDVIPADNK